MKINSKSVNALFHVWCIFGIGLVALPLASSPVAAASSQATDSTVQPSLAPAPSVPSAVPVAASAPVDHDYSFSDVISESMFGDVYADPSKWQELTFRNLFSKGWDKPWVSPPAGDGGAPRQGWLNAYDGVFYRLSIATFGWQHGTGNYTDGYAGALTSYTPLNQRMEIRTDNGLISN